MESETTKLTNNLIFIYLCLPEMFQHQIPGKGKVSPIKKNSTGRRLIWTLRRGEGIVCKDLGTAK